MYSAVAPIKSVQVDDIDIHFKDSLYEASYHLYTQKIHSIWIRGTILAIDYENQNFDFDDGFGRILRIQYCKDFILPQLYDTSVLTVGARVSIVCGISHIILDNEALLHFKLIKISELVESDQDYWPLKISEWQLMVNHVV